VSLDEGPSWALDRPTLLEGAALVLPDGSTLFVRYVKRKWYTVGLRDELWVERDGLPVPGSDGDPRVIGRRVGGLVIFAALLRLAILALAGSAAVEIGWPWLLAAESGLLLVLGVLAWSGLRVAALLAGCLFVAEIVTFPAGLVLQLLFAAYCLIGWAKMKPRTRAPNLREIFE